MAVGVEKVKDSGYQGLNAFPIPNDGTQRTLTAAAMFSMVAPAYAERTASPTDELKAVLARIASKNHYNGARNPRAQFRREMSVEQICAMPDGGRRASRCSTAPAWPTARPPRSSCRAEDAHRYTDTPLYVKALSFVAGNGSGLTDPAYDYTTFPEIVALRARTPTRRPASPTRGAELAMAEVHDCFTPTELVLMEDLGFCERGTAWKEVLGRRVRPRRRPARSTPTAASSRFGHPVGASGLRMMFEAWLQLRGEAPEERRIATVADRNLALTHNLGGYPGEMVSLRVDPRHRALNA